MATQEEIKDDHSRSLGQVARETARNKTHADTPVQ